MIVNAVRWLLEVGFMVGGILGLGMAADSMRSLRDPYKDFDWKAAWWLVVASALLVGGVKAVGMAWADINHHVTINFIVNTIRSGK